MPNNEEISMHDASTTINCVASTAEPHVSDVRTNRQEEPNQRWDPTVCQDTADDNDNDTSCHMPASCGAKESPPHKKKKNAMERPFCGRDSCDEKKSKQKFPLQKKKKLTGNSPRTHEVSAIEASSSRNCRYVRPLPDPRTAHVAIGSSVPRQGKRSGLRSFHFGMRVADS